MDLEDVLTAGRQVGAGFVSIPGDVLRLTGLLANPARAVRQISGEATPDDLTRYGTGAHNYVSNTLSGAGQAYIDRVNQVFGVNEPSPQDETLQFAARTLGGSPVLTPLKIASNAIAAAPLAVRFGAGLAESLTPATFTGQRGLRALPAVGVNVGAQTAVGIGAEAALEPHDPTQERQVYNANGELVEEYYPAPGVVPGSGRVAARAVAETVRDNPITSGIAGAGAVGLGILGYRGLRRNAAVQAAGQSSDVVVPHRPETTDVPITNTPIRILGQEIPGTSSARDFAYRVAEVVQDYKIKTKDAIEQVSETINAAPEETARVKSLLEGTNEVAHKDRVETLLREGRIVTPKQIINTESLDTLGKDVSRQLTPEQRTKLNELIAMESEWDDRMYAHKKGAYIEVNPTTMDIPEPDYTGPRMKILPRATLWNMPDHEIHNRIMQLRADPTITPYADRYWSFMRSAADAWEDFGVIDAAERAAWGNAHPHFMHMINMDEVKNPRTFRLRAHRSGPEFAGDPFLSSVEYADQFLSNAYVNLARKAVVDHVRQMGNGPFGNSPWFGRILDPRELARMKKPDGSPMTKQDFKLEGDILRFYDEGHLIEVEVKNKSMYHTLKTLPRMATSLLGWMRQTAQSGMTGRLATLSGQPFILANAVMGAVFGQLTRPKGYSYGLLDKMAQSATGGRMGIRGDPTAYAGMLHTAARSTGAIMARAIAESYYAGNSALAKIPGMDRIADYAAKKWVNSNEAWMHRAGARGASTLGEADWDAPGRASMIASVMPEYNRGRVVSDPRTFKEYVTNFARTATPADLKIGWRMLNDIQNAVGSMSQSYIFRSNFDKVQRAMARSPEEGFMELQKHGAVARSLLGDPSVMGTGLRDRTRVGATKPEKVVGNVLDMTPYANISVQASSQLMKAVKDNPAGVAAAMTMTLAPLVILPIANAIRLDNERMARGEDPIYMPWEFSRPDWHATRFVVIHIPGLGPEYSMEFRLDPLFSLPYTLAREATLRLFGLNGDPRVDPALGYTRDAIQRIAEERTGQNIYTAAVNSQPLSQFPPWMGAFFAATGIELPPLEKLISRGGAAPIPVRGMGGYEDTRLAHDLFSTRTQAVLSQLFGTAATTWVSALSSAWQSERRDPGSMATRVTSELANRAEDRIPEFAPLWDQQKRRTTSDPTAQMVNGYERSMLAIREGIAGAKNPGAIGSGSLAERGFPGGGAQGVEDPQMRDLLQSVNRVYSAFSGDGGLIAARNKVRKIMLDVEQRAMPYAERRMELNRLAGEVVRINQVLLAKYIREEDRLSNTYGRRIRIDRIDPTKPITQFPELIRQ